MNGHFLVMTCSRTANDSSLMMTTTSDMPAFARQFKTCSIKVKLPTLTSGFNSPDSVRNRLPSPAARIPAFREERFETVARSGAFSTRASSKTNFKSPLLDLKSLIKQGADRKDCVGEDRLKRGQGNCESLVLGARRSSFRFSLPEPYLARKNRLPSSCSTVHREVCGPRK